jgi:hypothetical protein
VSEITKAVRLSSSLTHRGRIAFVGSENKLADETGHEGSVDAKEQKSQSAPSATSASQSAAPAAPAAAAAEPRSATESQTSGHAPGSSPAPSIPSLQAALVNCAPPALAPLIGPLLDFAMALTGTPRSPASTGASQQHSMQARGAASPAPSPAAAVPSAAPAASESTAPAASAEQAKTGAAPSDSNTSGSAPPSLDEIMARCRAQGEAQGRAFGDLAAARAERLGRPRAPSPEPQAPAEQQTGPSSTAGSEAFEVVEHEAPAAQASASTAASTGSTPAPQPSERVVQTNTALSSAWEQRLAQMGHSGLSRAQRMEQEREAARRFEERQRAMMEQMEREEAEEAAKTSEAQNGTEEKGKGKAQQEEAAQPASAAPKPNVADTNASLAR